MARGVGNLYENKMGNSRFFCIESKTFELCFGEGESSKVRIYERGKDSVRSVFMGKESAIRLVADMGELLMKPHVDSFVHTMREGDVVILIQRCSNRKVKYVLIQEIR